MEATAAAEEIRAGIEERDQLLRDGDAVLEAKEAELDEAAAYALSLQRELDELRAEQERMRAERDAGSPPRPSEEENARNKEALILHLKSENEAQVRAAQQEIDTLRFQLEERDVAVSDAEGRLAEREAECAKLQSEVFAKSNALSPLRQRADAAQNVLNAMEKELDSRDAQLKTVTDQLMAAMSAEKRQTRAVARLEMTLAEREETVRNMGEQLKEVSTKAGLASAAKRERDQYAEMFENAERARQTLEHSLASNRDENVRRLHLAEQERTAALSRAEALQAAVSSKEAQQQSLVEKAAAAERAAEFERTKLAGLAAAADEAVENANAQVIETRAELEGQMLQMRTELGHKLEEAEARAMEAQSAAEAKVRLAESQLKASREEISRLKEETELARRSAVSSDVDRQLRQRLEGDIHVAKTNAASANVRYEEARKALKAAETRSLEIEGGFAPPSGNFTRSAAIRRRDWQSPRRSRPNATKPPRTPRANSRGDFAPRSQPPRRAPRRWNDSTRRFSCFGPRLQTRGLGRTRRARRSRGSRTNSPPPASRSPPPRLRLRITSPRLTTPRRRACFFWARCRWRLPARRRKSSRCTRRWRRVT